MSKPVEASINTSNNSKSNNEDFNHHTKVQKDVKKKELMKR